MPPTPFDVAAPGRRFSEEVIVGIQAWRLRHPPATRQEIEAAGDARVAELHMQMLQDVALASRAADVS